MKRMLRYILPSIGTLSILLFCVNATASLTNSPGFVAQTVLEPMNMMLIGLGLIGLGNFLRKKPR